jgi:hypothetical protein
MKLYSKPNQNGKRQFLGWEASYWSLKKKFDGLANKRYMEEITSEQMERYRQSQYVVMENEKEIKRLKKLLRKNEIEY